MSRIAAAVLFALLGAPVAAQQYPVKPDDRRRGRGALAG